MTCWLSGGQAGATLATTVRENRAAARVRIRRRKPWVLARRRLFGWKVRLLTRGLQKESVVAGCRPGCHRAPTSSSYTPECTASRSLEVTCAHRRQAAAAIDNSTWLRYARLRHPVKPASARRHYPQAGDNNLNRSGRPDYRGQTPIRSLLTAPAALSPPHHPTDFPTCSQNHTFVGPMRERALWLTYLPILPQCGHEYWNNFSVRAVVRASRRRTSTGSSAASLSRWSRTPRSSRSRTSLRRAYSKAVSRRSSARP